jgi:plastocyanin
MPRSLPTLIVCAALALLAGCGSSGGPSTRAPTTATSASGAGGGLKVATTPKYAAPPAGAPVQGGTVQVAYRNITIAPDTVRVRLGSTIRWTNYDAVLHNVTSEGGPVSFRSGNLGQGATFTLRATRLGVIHYQCTIHPTTMNGTIEVVR